jgi:agmatine deiminase
MPESARATSTAPSPPSPVAVSRSVMARSDTPAALGFRMPAEWEPHCATWIGWPHKASDWPGKLVPITWVYGEIVRHLAVRETVRILVNGASEERAARRVLERVGADLERLDFVRFPTDRGWTRDYGPWFLKRKTPRPELAIARFRFNAWAKYPDWKRDDRVAERAARRLDVPLFRARAARRAVVLEGGSVDVNGRGTLVTTEECLLDLKVQARNPGLSQGELEAVLRDYLGVTTILWLGRGIAGDDTHGHVDDVCRFVDPHTLVLASETDPHDVNYRALEENRERLEGLRLADGSKPAVVALPMPAPLYFAGRRLPASYANFYIANGAVLVPTFNDPQDRVALGILAELITDRPVVGIHAVDLVWGFGTVHCLTQQEPSL